MNSSSAASVSRKNPIHKSETHNITATAAAVLLALSLSSAATAAQESETRLLRFPDIHGDRVVFCYGGDLWRAPAAGGTATRLTAHPGREVFPRFSPDGEWIAFTGQYDGDEQVYVMPADGGEPRRLTWYPARGPLPPPMNPRRASAGHR